MKERLSKNIKRINKTFDAYGIMVIHMRKVFFLLFLLLLLGFGFYLNTPHLYFVDDVIEISLNEEVKPYDYIRKYYNVDKEDVVFESDVNNQECGEYKIKYFYLNKTRSLKVIVKDNIAPSFDIVNRKIFLNETIEASSMVENIKDQTKTVVYFYEDYIFNEEKTYPVEVVVEDEYANKTKKKAYILVESKDIEAPQLSGIDTLEIREGQSIDLTKNVVKYDDHDLNPQLIVDDSQFDMNKSGEYSVIYTVKDSSGNQTVSNRKVLVKSKYSNIEAKKDGIKTCYLTFDDGPSYNTPKVLDILDKYNIKATFFVTGTHSDSYQYINEAKERGHSIGLHTYSHDYEEIYTSLAAYLKDLKKIKQLAKEQAGVDTNIIRFPGGSSNLVSKKYNVGIMKRLVKKVVDEGYQYYDWTCVNGDGENVKTVNGLIKMAKQETGDLEDIMFLMHDGSSNDATVEALPSIIEYLIDQGYIFKAIDETSPTFHHTVQN